MTFDPLTPTQAAGIANAARDMCRDFIRFERDMERLAKAIQDAGGSDHPGISRAVNQGVGDSADLRTAWEKIAARAVGP